MSKIFSQPAFDLMKVRSPKLMLKLAVAGGFALAQIAPAFATIDNTATPQASTTPTGTVGAQGAPASAHVPVQTPAPAMTVAKTAAAPTTTHTVNGSPATMAGDTITYTYVITNTGNVTLTGVAPVDVGPKFNGTAGTGTLSAFTPASATIAPGSSTSFSATYTLTAQDVFEAAGVTNGVTNSATATGTTPGGTGYTSPAGTSTAQITAAPGLCVTKTAALPSGHTSAQLGDTVTYTYAVNNCGNVTMYNIQVVDMHGTPAVQVGLGAGGITNDTLTTPSPTGSTASTDATANNGIWSVLGAGATVTFTWAHTVTQAEIDHG